MKEPISASPRGAKTQYGSLRQCTLCTVRKSFALTSFHERKMSTSIAQIAPTR